MEKLIELLNEYDGDALEYGFVDGNIRRKVKNFNNEKNTWKSVVWYTKEFGFIKWLITKRKIDRDKFDERREEGNKYLRITGVNDYELLLMLLAIQDKPIEFLISILKQHDKVMRGPIH